MTKDFVEELLKEVPQGTEMTAKNVKKHSPPFSCSF